VCIKQYAGNLFSIDSIVLFVINYIDFKFPLWHFVSFCLSVTVHVSCDHISASQ